VPSGFVKTDAICRQTVIAGSNVVVEVDVLVLVVELVQKIGRVVNVVVNDVTPR